LRKNFPDRADKVLRQIKGAHGGKLYDHAFGRRMRGEGVVAESVKNLFRLSKQKYFAGRAVPDYNYEAFLPRNGKQLNLF